MGDVQHEDTYKIKSDAGLVGVKVRVFGGHAGAWVVMLDGMPVPPQPDGFVVLGEGRDVRGRDVLVITTVDKISPNPSFTVEHDVREIGPTGGSTMPFVVTGKFDAVSTADVEETIVFE
jgi:hypothetical protein